MILRAYDPERDREATRRIWREVGWIEKEREEGMSRYVEAARALVGEIDGEAECLVCTAPGDIRFLTEDLPLSAVTGVTTSRIARKQGLAGRLLAQALALDAAEGALVAALGMFEQGYYNHLGFGTLGYEHMMGFDPAHLNVQTNHRVPKRLAEKDFEVMHAARLARRRGHGSVNLYASVYTQFEMHETDDQFGAGYFNESGRLTHALWVRPKDVENGPYTVEWIVFNTRAEFLELMSLLKSWGDQVHLVKIPEPAGVQLQDLIRLPVKQSRVTRLGKFATGCAASAYFQMRMLDLPGCLAKTRLNGPSIRFNLRLSDPIERFLESGSSWPGVGGDYIVTLGPESRAQPGTDGSLPYLAATVNAFTRMWLGARPASGLATTDEITGPHELLDQLDRVLCLPPPVPDWEF